MFHHDQAETRPAGLSWSGRVVIMVQLHHRRVYGGQSARVREHRLLVVIPAGFRGKACLEIDAVNWILCLCHQ